ncbi:alpha/beta hydrolase family protein [Candidatus Finniella inopinata]|uniref:Peptidase S9 prolyl oligopeptidase catalytic domain-containing protein n=1 Tax=Candidatus Finniella inopinata TaxID=1696036 RepID=A0A4Q7DG40_9PROT|nr:prolyl oligopeptidase family serine peptidase [Candidatus Finniella inopinata]RZI45753.1 hypothetical protein EQU50_06530 [Candidatus Finniella inopinata]
MQLLFIRNLFLFVFFTIINLQGHTAQAPAEQSQLAKFLGDTFKDDKSASPFTNAPDDCSQLIDAVVNHMRVGDDEQLRRLFYQPDVNAWVTFYQQVTKKQFSTVDLIDLLDQTKSRLFAAYSGKSADDDNAYFYAPTLFDQLMQQIFAGCWGISDQPTPDDTINHLKRIYGRVVSGLATVHEYYPLGIIKSLESKKAQSSPIETAHFAALQECAASVYSHLRATSGVDPYSVDDFRLSTNVSFFLPSFEKTLGQIHYQNPLSCIYGHPNFRTLAWSLINPEKENVPFNVPGFHYFGTPIFHPSIVEWEDTYTSYCGNSFLFFAKAEGCWWIWSKEFEWSKRLPGWNPIKNRQDILERLKAALKKEFGTAENVELESEQFDPFHFSTAVKFKGENGFQRIVWSTQKPDCSVEIQDFGDIHLDGFLYPTGKTLAWQSPDKKWHLMRFKGSGVDRCLESLYPQEYVDILSYTYKYKERTLEIKTKKPGAEGCEYWSYNTDTDSWKQLSEDERELSSDEAQAYLKAQYPEIGINFFSYSPNEILTSLCDPKTVTQERFVIFTRNPGARTYSERQLFVAQADSIVYVPGNTRVVSYKELDGKLCAKKLVNDVLENALPPHETIENWHEVEFNGHGDLLLASRVTNHGRKSEYWTLKNGEWHLLYNGENFKYCLNKVNFANTDRVYRSSYNEAGLTLELLNPDTLSFEPTNVQNTLVSVTDHESRDFIVSQEDPRVIVAVKDYHNGLAQWKFLDTNLSKQYDSFRDKLQAKWTEEGREFATAPLTVSEFKLNDNQICEIAFFFHQNMAINGLASLQGEEVLVEWSEYFDKVNHTLHPPLQAQTVKVDGHDVPYYYLPPVKDNNKKTLILMQGGPIGYYEGAFSDIIHYYTQNGWQVIIPQESLRTGYGWKHFIKGIGEMGRKNLHQLLHVFYDAKVKGLIPDINQVSLYGHSYGGFVAASFALRWSELHKEAGLAEEFHFQSIVADAALVSSDSNPDVSAIALPDDALGNPADYFRKIMPINRVTDPLSAPLYLVHGVTDVRCSAAYIKDFKQALKKARKNVPLYLHSGRHNPPAHPCYPEFVAALMEGKPTGELEKEIGLSIE